VILCALIALASSDFVPKQGKLIDYAYVDQIFRKYDCVDCHNDVRPASRLNLTTYDGLMAGGRQGSDIQAGKSADSLMIKLMMGLATPHMPPGHSQVSDSEITMLKSWIDAGATSSAYGQALSHFYQDKKDQKWDAALKDADAIGQLSFDGIDTKEAAARLRLPIFEMQKDESGFYDSAKTIIGAHLANGNILNDIAWIIVDPQGWIKKPDLSLALDAANGAVANTRRQSGAVLDTLAWVYFRQGDKDKAIATEKEAMTCSDAQGQTLESLKQSMKAFGG